MIDFDGIVNTSIAGVFGQPVMFKPAAGATYQVIGIFDRHHEVVLDEIARSESRGAGHSTTAPVLSVRLAQFAVMPDQDCEVTIGAETFVIYDVQPDGRGMADLVLREKV